MQKLFMRMSLIVKWLGAKEKKSAWIFFNTPPRSPACTIDYLRVLQKEHNALKERCTEEAIDQLHVEVVEDLYQKEGFIKLVTKKKKKKLNKDTFLGLLGPIIRRHNAAYFKACLACSFDG